jgi:NADPH2:quinone reductase
MTLPTTMRAWRLHKYGNPLDVLQLEDVPLPPVPAGGVLVKAEGIPLNLNDLERINGGNMMVRPEFPYSPGMEVTGVVVAAGEGAESWLGKRVNATTEGAHGGYAEYVSCPLNGCFAMDEDIPLPDAAAMFFPFHLAWLGLYDRARLSAGETVLIHAAAGGSGSAAIQLAKKVGARVIATAGSEEKLALCRSLGADHVVNYRKDDFKSVVMELTQGKGVDVVFDNVGESVFEHSIQCIAYNGRYLMMGFASNKLVADEKFVVPRHIALGNFGLYGVMLAYADPNMQSMLKTAMGWNFPPRALGEKIQADILAAYRKGEVKPVIGQRISFEDLPAWIHKMSEGQTSGRIVATL